MIFKQSSPNLLASGAYIGALLAVDYYMAPVWRRWLQRDLARTLRGVRKEQGQ